MQEFSFRALGTVWSILVDAPSLPFPVTEAVLGYVNAFEKRFSRFLPTSEVNAFRQAAAGTYPISDELAILLERAAKLRVLTDGVYDPAVGGLLERAGYGMQQASGEQEASDAFLLPHWSLIGTELCLDGPTMFDIGGIGKGYCIDGVARVLETAGYPYFLVEGGGDMFGTTKKDGTPWQVAIEYPGKPELAAGTLELAHQGLAVSDRFRRRFGKWHHIVHPQEKCPISSIDGCAAVARSAWDADCVTSGLFLVTPQRYISLAGAWQATYLVFLPEGKAKVGDRWPGHIFTAPSPDLG